MRLIVRILLAAALTAAVTACTTPNGSGVTPYADISQNRHPLDTGGGISGKSTTQPAPTPEPTMAP